MSNIVTPAFFIGEITIPNTNTQAVIERINAFVVKRETECLLKILGYPLYKLFLTESSQRMTELMDGGEYVECGDTKAWQGLVHDTVYSLLAYYIYYFIQENSATNTTGTSTSLPAGKDQVNYSPADKMVTSWNLFSEDVESMCSFLWNKKDLAGVRVYPEFTGHQYNVTRNFSRKISADFQF